MAVITISREMGSTGDWISDKCFLADRLIDATGYHYADKKFFSRLFREYGLTQFDREYTQTLGFWERFDSQRDENRATIVDLLNKATVALARHGNVIIVGRANFAMLQGLTDVLNVRVQASLPTRVAAVQKRFKLTDPGEAEAIVLKNDELRESFIREFYTVRGDWADGFDLVVNTTKFGPQVAVDILLAGLKQLDARKGQGPDSKTLPEDAGLADAVNNLLACRTKH